MSKALFPGLRLGFLIVPTMYAAAFRRLGTILPSSVSSIEQRTLAEFITTGHYARHVRKIRKLSDEKRRLLLEVLHKHLPRWRTISSQDAGMHLVLHFPKRVSDVRIAQELSQQNIQVLPISECFVGQPTHSGLVVHYAGFRNRQIKEAGERMCKVVRKETSL